jgi:hypothetical protein
LDGENETTISHTFRQPGRTNVKETIPVHDSQDFSRSMLKINHLPLSKMEARTMKDTDAVKVRVFL